MPETEKENPPTCELLTAWVQRGCENSFGLLVDRYSKLVYGTAMRCTGGRQDLAPDISQRVFIDLARRAPQLVRDERLGLWLHKRTRWTSADFLKSERRRQKRETLSAMEQMHAEEGTPRWEEWAPELDAALAKLSKADRQAILLRFMEGKRLAAVGKVMGVREDTARKRVSRALDKLRSKMAKRGVALSASGLLAALNAESAGAAIADHAQAWKEAAVAAKATGVAGLVSQWIAPAGSAMLGAALITALSLPALARHNDSDPPSLTLSQRPGTGEKATQKTTGPNTGKKEPEPESEPKPQRIGMREFVARMATVYEQPASPLRDSRQRELFEQLEPGLGLALGEQILASPIDATQLDGLVRQLVYYWLDDHQVDRLDLYDFLVDRWPPGMQHRNRLGWLAEFWVEADPAAAQAWLEAAERDGRLLRATGTHGYRELRKSIIEKIASGIRKRDGQEAQIAFLIDAMNRTSWISDAPSLTSTDQDAEQAAFAALEKVESPVLRIDSRCQIVRHVEFHSPGEGRTLIDALPSGEERAALAFRMGHEIFAGNVGAIIDGREIIYEDGNWAPLLDWTIGHLLPTRRPFETAALMQQWTKHGDLGKATEWLAQHPEVVDDFLQAKIRSGIMERKRSKKATPEELAALEEIGIKLEKEESE